MPSKNTVKIYIPNGIYHIYNRGVEKRKIFLDEQDYKIFLFYLRSYLTSLEQQIKPPPSIKYLSNFDLYKNIQLFVYCLMPTHFHFMLKQVTEKAIVEFMKRLSNAYVEYFNKKYERVGPLFQGRYKAAHIDEENYFLHLPRYIHLNPLELFKNEKDKFKKLREYPYSSYSNYIGYRKSDWLYSKDMLNYFEGNRDELGFSNYQEFVEKFQDEDKNGDAGILSDLITLD